MLQQQTLFGKIDKVEIAIERLQTFEPPEGYWLATSGGKDSIVIQKLAEMAQVKHVCHYNLTTIDPPELVRFIRKYHPQVVVHKPKQPFLKRLVEKGFPLRQRRWCCKEYKENTESGHIVITGIRWAESYKRTKRKMVEQCYRNQTKFYVNPIIDWTAAEVWEFIGKYNLPYCSLYDEGFKRLGCVLCPMASDRQRQAERWPDITRGFKRAFNRLYERRLPSHARWKSGEEMFAWWISKHPKKQYPDQSVLFE